MRADGLQRGQPLFRIDPGWPYVLAGSALISATVLIPAADDLRDAQWRRDQALAVERHTSNRLQNHSDYLDALDDGDPTLVRSLAAMHLNLAPVGSEPLPAPWEAGGPASLSPYAQLEPELRLPVKPGPPRTTLHRLATGAQSRLWLFAGGALCILIGILPPSERREAADDRSAGGSGPGEPADPRGAGA